MTDRFNWVLAEPLERRVLLSAAVFAAADLPKPINDRAAVSSSLAVSGLSGGVGAVTVALDAEHARDADVRVELLSPAGTRVLLFAGVGGVGQDFFSTGFSDEARTPVDQGTAPFRGTF